MFRGFVAFLFPPKKEETPHPPPMASVPTVWIGHTQDWATSNVVIQVDDANDPLLWNNLIIEDETLKKKPIKKKPDKKSKKAPKGKRKK